MVVYTIVLFKIFVTGKPDMWMKMIHLDDFINMQEFVTPLLNYVCGKQVKLVVNCSLFWPHHHNFLLWLFYILSETFFKIELSKYGKSFKSFWNSMSRKKNSTDSLNTAQFYVFKSVLLIKQIILKYFCAKFWCIQKVVK